MKAPYYDRQTWLRITLKVLAILIVVNVLYIVLRPYDAIAAFSIVGPIVPLRNRLVILGRENQDQLARLEMLLHAHEISQPKATDEFRVVVLGDSGINGFAMADDQTINAYLTTAGINVQGRKIKAYNLAYFGFNATRDLLIADAALDYQPDLILWFVTENTFVDSPPDPLIAFNQPRMTRLTAQFQLSDMNAQLYGHYQDTWWQNSIFAQRAELFQWMNFQSYALRRNIYPSMNPNGIRDHMDEQYAIPADAPKTISMPNANWLPLTALPQLTKVPILIVNEPILIVSDSVITYDGFYVRKLYDQYRQAFSTFCTNNQLWCLDLWDTLPFEDYTDSPLHHTPEGNKVIASHVANEIERKLDTQ